MSEALKNRAWPLVDRAVALLSNKKGIALQIEIAKVRERITYLWLRPVQIFRSWRNLLSAPPIKPFDTSSAPKTAVDKHWSWHTVGGATPLKSEKESLEYMEFFRTQAPLKYELLDLENKHEGEVLLDYGCGTGNDLVGFALKSRARRIIGADVSLRALGMARRRLALHAIDWDRIQFQQLSDLIPRIPLEGQSIDYIHSAGVLHHTTHPMEVLSEFYRLLKPNGTCRIMVYNADSIYVNLNVAYEIQVKMCEYPGKTAERAFEEKADLGAPLALCRDPQYWLDMASQVGFEASFQGAYFSRAELPAWETLKDEALRDERLPERHKAFLRSIEVNADGFPLFNDLPAGMSAVILLEKGTSS